MGHTLNDYIGKCHNLHGHNYRLLVEVSSPRLNDIGMVMDFGDLKALVETVIDNEFDHRFLVHREDTRADDLVIIDPNVVLCDYNPTAEQIASDLRDKIRFVLDRTVDPPQIESITLWETNNSYAKV